MKDKIAFLDRDGVVNRKAQEHEYIKTWSEFHFCDKSINGIRLLNKAGYKVIIVTNQRGIARKIMSKKDLEQIHDEMLAVIRKNGAEINAIYYCPHDIGECNCRKPNIGMFLQAEKDFNIDKEKSFIIGDSISDMDAGEKYGIKNFLLNEKESLDILVKKILSLDSVNL